MLFFRLLSSLYKSALLPTLFFWAFQNCLLQGRGVYVRLRVLRAHGLQGKDLWQVCEATTVSYLTYASPAWWGYADANSRQRLQSVLNKLKKHGFLPHEFPSHEELCEQMCRGYSIRSWTTNSMFYISCSLQREKCHILSDLERTIGPFQLHIIQLSKRISWLLCYTRTAIRYSATNLSVLLILLLILFSLI